MRRKHRQGGLRRSGRRGRRESPPTPKTPGTSQTGRSIDRLLPGFVHQFRTPLATMHSLLESALSAPSSMRNTSETFSILLKNVKRLQQNVQALLLYARGDTPNYLTGSLNDPIQSLIDYLQPICATHQIRLEVQLAAKLDFVRYQPQLLQEALSNYAVNGIEAMRPGGTLTIRTFMEANGFAVIEIKDTGTGMPAQPAKAFSTTKKGGMGLGLIFSRHVLNAHEAKIKFESHIGEGTVVTLHFPVIPDEMTGMS